MRCGICLQVFKDPIELPCYHFFCLDCLRRQSTIEKTSNQLPRCAECKREFNMRSIIANRTLQSHNLKINKILDVYRWIRQANEIYSQDVPDVQEMINLNQERIQ